MASIDATAQEIREIIEQLISNNDELASISSEATAVQVNETVEVDALEDVDLETYQAALDQVLADYGVTEVSRADAVDQLEAADDYSAAGLMDHLSTVVSDSTVHTAIDNSLHTTGEVHGNIHQANQDNLANATAEDAIAGRDQHGNFQTGDGQQVDGSNDGVMNQGDNSGQQAGYDAYADNITTGDGNMVGSTGATVGHGNVSADGAHINAYDSAVNLGSGSADYNEEYTDNSTFDDHSTYDDHADLSHNVDIDNSGNSTSILEDNDPITTDVDVDIDIDEGHDHHDMD